MATRLRRAEQVERNREEVLAAARQVFLDRGYAKATVEGIADIAGFTTGVVYSQFGSKADLFLALLERRIAERAARHDDVAGRLAGADGVRAVLQTVRRDSDVEAEWARVLIEFRLVAAREPELNARYAALHAETVDRLAATLGGLHDRAGTSPVLPPPVMARFLLAVGTGVALERAVEPAALTDAELLAMVPAAFGWSS
jgi:AcrR family transcriptional regulator